MWSLNKIREINREPDVEDYGLTLEEMLILAGEVKPSSWRDTFEEESGKKYPFYEGKSKRNIAVRFGYECSYIEVLSKEISVGCSIHPYNNQDFGKESYKKYFLARDNAELNTEKEKKKEEEEQKRLIKNVRALVKMLRDGKA